MWISSPPSVTISIPRPCPCVRIDSVCVSALSDYTLTVHIFKIQCTHTHTHTLHGLTSPHPLNFCVCLFVCYYYYYTDAWQFVSYLILTTTSASNRAKDKLSNWVSIDTLRKKEGTISTGVCHPGTFLSRRCQNVSNSITCLHVLSSCGAERFTSCSIGHSFDSTVIICLPSMCVCVCVLCCCCCCVLCFYPPPPLQSVFLWWNP